MIERSLFKPHLILDEEFEDDYHLDNSPRDTELARDISPNEQENINEIRKLIREQSFLGISSTDTIKVRNQNRYFDLSDDIDVSIRRFTPLPGIPRFEDPYYRTESQLLKNEITNDSYKDSFSLKRSLTNEKYSHSFEADNYYNSNIKNKTQLMFTRGEAQKINHFSSIENKSNKKCVHRLPALEKSINHSYQNTMDLDEDLPLNIVNESINRRGIYTSPGERLVSPVKRPQAPSPACSEYRRCKGNPKSPDILSSDLRCEM